MDQSTKLLIELREVYTFDLDKNGHPKPGILDMVGIWQRVNDRIEEIQPSDDP